MRIHPVPLTALALLLVAAAGLAQQAQFAELVPLPTDSAMTWDVDAGDVDGDGDPDIVYTNDGQNTIYINRGDLGFADETASRFPARAFNSREIRLVDMDGDQDLDVVVAGAGPNRIMLNDGTGVFRIAPIPRDNSFSEDFDVGDIDGDGDLDIYWGNGDVTNEQNRLWRNDNMTFVDVTATNLPTLLDPTTGVKFADLNVDGAVDLLVANDRGQNQLYINNGSGTFVTASVLLPQEATASDDVITADFDGDGDDDILFADRGTSVRCLYLRNEGGLLYTNLRSSFPMLQSFFQEATAADVDGDGDFDILLTAYGSETRLIVNDGAANFVLTPISRTPPETQRTTGIAVADLDDDQDLDFVLSNFRTQNRTAYNLTRQVHTPRPARLGGSYDIEFYAHAGFIQQNQPIAGLITVVPGGWQGFTLPLPPWGNLHIPPAIAVAMPPITVAQSTGGKVAISTSIPASQSLRGLKILIQAGVLHTPNVVDLRLTNLVIDAIQ